MARVRAILTALWTAARRESKSVASFTGNNFFLAGIAFAFFGDPGALVLFNLLIGLILFFPLSTDPQRKIPPERLALWPISPRERGLLRILSPWLNPVTWFLAALAVSRRVTLGLWVLIASLFAIAFVIPLFPLADRKGLWRSVPPLPGSLNHLIRKNVREMLCTLDFYCGLLLSVAALLFRILGLLPREALLPLTLLVTIALSTYTQSLFGLDGEGGLTRYRLLPTSGWQILSAKDAAFLMVALVLTLPLAPLAGLAAALTALAVGHAASVDGYRDQTRWRFTSAGPIGFGILQMLLMGFAAGATVYRWWMLAPCVVIYAASTWSSGRKLEQHEW